MNAEKIYSWIMARFDEGRTVYVTTYTRCTAYKPKHRTMFRVKGSHCEVQHGKYWDSINFCKITAQ